MDKESIQQIATEIVAHLPFGARYSVVYGVVTVLIAGLGVWFGSFLKTKGQNFATKRDFDELKRQLSANTKLVETIKSEVSQRDWAQREWTNLRRIKLEALIEKMHECEAYLDRSRSAALSGSSQDERDVIGEFETISEIYFPELRKQAHEFAQTCRKETVVLLKFAKAVLEAGDNSAAFQSAFDSFNEQFRPDKRLLAGNPLRDAARALLKRIMNVDEGTAPSDER